MYVIECSDLEKTYGHKKAINGLNLQIEEDKIIGLIGRNGAGKTTLLRMCAGLLSPTSGSLNLWGEAPFDNLNVLKKTVFSAEEIAFDDTYRIHEILDLASTYYEGWEPSLAAELIQIFGLNPRTKIKKLSKGMKSMVNTTLAICSRRPLTLFDEPTAGLDAAHRKDFYNLIIKESSEYPRTMIISSHLLSEIEPLLEEIILIDEGKVVLHVPVDEIRNSLIQLEGATPLLQKIIEGKQTWNHFEALGKTRVAVRRESLTDQDLKYNQENNIQMSNVSSQDACIYLTEKEGK